MSPQRKRVFASANVPEHSKLYETLQTGGAFIVLALAILAVVYAYMFGNSLLFRFAGLDFAGAPSAIAPALLYLAASLKMVRADEHGGAYCYDKALKRLSAGLHFIPFGFSQIKSVSRKVQEFQCPDEPEKTFKGDDRKELPPGMVRPIRIVTRAPKESEKGMLDEQMTLVVSFVFQYVVKDIFDYVANFGDTKLIEKQLRDIGESVIAEEATRRTPAGFIRDLPALNEKISGEVQDRFENSGVEIISARLIAPDVSHKVSSALADIPIARAGAKKKVIDAQGEAKAIEINAEAQKNQKRKVREGEAAGELAWLEAQAQGREKMMKSLDVSGEVVVAAEAIRELSPKTDTLVVGAEGGLRDIMAMVKGAAGALKSNPKEV